MRKFEKNFEKIKTIYGRLKEEIKKQENKEEEEKKRKEK
jgi:hypothetical protein